MSRIIAVHLDLKGVPPTPARLLELVPVFAAAGYNAILVEWEDMFPWTVDPRFRNETAYTPELVRRFHAAAHAHYLEIIPLVQCLGHMETPLQFPEYHHLREVPHRSDVLNPLAPGARELVEKMIDDVLALTPRLRYFHLGGDEAWTFGTHPDTHDYIEQHGRGKLYLHHVEPLLDKLLAKNIRPILWHDMMIHWESDALKALAKKADLCAWGYRGTHDKTHSHWQPKYLDQFQQNGIPLWGATAYKGAEFESEDLPDLTARQTNCQSWADIADRYHMVGLVATAWSRFSTDRVQNSPIDSALDSLFLCGSILRGTDPALDASPVLLLERERFNNCHAAMKQLQDFRKSFWQTVQYLREGLACATLDPRRRSGGNCFKYLENLQGHHRLAEEAAQKARLAFKGLIDDLWIDRYLSERLLPMQQELHHLVPEVQNLAPPS